MGNMAQDEQDQYYMQCALTEAHKAYQKNEVPVGSVIVCHGTIIAKTHNSIEQDKDATAHAELKAIQAACKYKGMKYLTDCTLYTTLEPCYMCASACNRVQIDRLVFGAKDPKQIHKLNQAQLLHSRTQIHGGVYAQASKELIQKFFRQLRIAKEKQ